MAAMQVRYVGDEARFDRALDLFQHEGEWRRVLAADRRVVGYAMPSMSRPGLWHEATPSRCDCEDRKYRGGNCAHMIAAQMYVDTKRAVSAQQITKEVA